jgi:glycerol uptake facilitator-like aquaporin
MSLCYLSALIHITIGSLNTSQVAGYVGISNIFLLSLFIYALAPSSGGHVNPLITFTTVMTALTGFSRGFLYIVGQTLGAAIAGGLIRGSFGEELTQQYVAPVNIWLPIADWYRYGGGGCYFKQSALSDGQLFLIEAMSSFIML